MMKNHLRGVAAAIGVALATSAPALAEENLRTEQGVACASDGGPCARFQGYVYVRRSGAAAPPVRRWSGAAPSGFGERRLYLNMGAAEAR